MSLPELNRPRVLFALLLVILVASVVAASNQNSAGAQEIDAPDRLEFNTEFIGELAVGARTEVAILDRDTQDVLRRVVLTPSLPSAAIEIPANLDTNGLRQPRELYVSVQSTDSAEQQMTCTGQVDSLPGSGNSTLIYLTSASGATDVMCDVTTYAPWNFELLIDGGPDGQSPPASFRVYWPVANGTRSGSGGVPFGNIVPGIPATEIDLSVAVVDSENDWIGRELRCDNGVTIPVLGTNSFWIEIEHDRRSHLSCTLDVERTVPPTTLKLSSLVDGLANVEFGESALTIGDGGPYFWSLLGFESQLDNGGPLTIKHELSPAEDWEITGFICNDDTEATWEATGATLNAEIDVPSDERTRCTVAITHFPTRETTDIDVVVTAPPNTNPPPIRWGENTLPLTVAQAGDAPVRITVGRDDSLRVSKLRDWSTSLTCTGDIVDDTLQSSDGQTLTVKLRADETPRTPERCTIALEPTGPVVVNWSQFYPDDPTAVFAVTIGNQSASVSHGETASFELPPGSISVEEFGRVAGAGVDKITCTSRTRTDVFAPEPGDHWPPAMAAPRLDDALGGEVISCVSVFTPRPADTYQYVSVTFANPNDEPIVWTIEDGAGEQIEVTVTDDPVVLDAVLEPISLVSVDHGPNYINEFESCDGGTIDVRTCLATSVPAPPVTVDFTASFDGPGEPPIFTPVSATYTQARYSRASATIDVPIGWQAQAIVCDPAAPAWTEPITERPFIFAPARIVAGKVRASVDVTSVAADSRLQCEVQFVAARTVPFDLRVVVEDEPDADVAVRFGLSDRTEEILVTSAAVVETKINLAFGYLTVVAEPVPGFEPAPGSICYGARGPYLISGTRSSPYWSLEWDSASAIGCELRLIRTEPTTIGDDVAGDVNCDGVLNILDAFATAQYVVQLRDAATGCPLTDRANQMNSAALAPLGDQINIQTAFKVSQCVVRLSNELCPEPIP